MFLLADRHKYCFGDIGQQSADKRLTAVTVGLIGWLTEVTGKVTGGWQELAEVVEGLIGDWQRLQGEWWRADRSYRRAERGLKGLNGLTGGCKGSQKTFRGWQGSQSYCQRVCQRGCQRFARIWKKSVSPWQRGVDRRYRRAKWGLTDIPDGLTEGLSQVTSGLTSAVMSRRR